MTEMRDSLARAGPGNLKISFQKANHEGMLKNAQENMVAARAQNPGIMQPATAVPVLKLYYQRTKIQPAVGHGRSSTKVVLPENENPAGRRPRPFQY